MAALESRLAHIKQQQAATQDNAQFQSLHSQLETLENEVKVLSAEKDEWENAVAGGVEGKRMEIEKLRAEAAVSTDDLYALEDHLRAFLDRDGIVNMRKELYGELCPDGGDLPDTDDI